MLKKEMLWTEMKFAKNAEKLALASYETARSNGKGNECDEAYKLFIEARSRLARAEVQYESALFSF